MSEVGLGSRKQTGRPLLGYGMVALGSVLFAVNGVVAKVILVSGVTSLRLTELRSTGAALGLGLVVVLLRPGRLRVARRELVHLASFGCAVASVQLFYFLAIRRLDLGVALLLQYTGPLLIALWARFFAREPVRRRIWYALALALVGLSLVVDVWRGFSLDGLGVSFALLAALAYAFYVLLAERGLGERDPLSLLAWGFALSSLLWALTQPWWSFPVELVARDVSLLGRLGEVQLPMWALLCWFVVLGTMAPFMLVVGALRHLPATSVAITAMVEPVAGGVAAYAWLGETLGVAQLAGCAIVLVAIFLAQTAR